MFEYVSIPETIHIAVDHRQADRADQLFDVYVDRQIDRTIAGAISKTLCHHTVLSGYVSNNMELVTCPLCLVKLKEIEDLAVALTSTE